MIAKNINFLSKYKDIIPEPKPSLLHIPNEYKKMKSFHNESFYSTTVKKCIPFLDALTCGYIIPFPIDYGFRYDQEKSMAIFETNLEVLHDLNDFKRSLSIETHNQHQLSEELRHNKRTVEAVFKFSNPWVIKTPPGYSCIFTQPFNRNFPFKIIDGIVDTDTFHQNINFPFYWTNPHTEKVILKRGSPMVLVIPFKRERWKMNVYSEKPKDLEKKEKAFLKFSSKIMDRYKNSFWRRKEYK